MVVDYINSLKVRKISSSIFFLNPTTTITTVFVVIEKVLNYKSLTVGCYTQHDLSDPFPDPQTASCTEKGK